MNFIRQFFCIALFLSFCNAHSNVQGKTSHQSPWLKAEIALFNQMIPAEKISDYDITKVAYYELLSEAKMLYEQGLLNPWIEQIQENDFSGIEKLKNLNAALFNGSHLPAELQKPIASPTPSITNRIQLLDFFPKNIKVAEIGVEIGIYSESLFKILKPKELCLIDCWRALDEQDDPVHSHVQKVQEQNYQIVKEKFADKSNVRVIRECSREGSLLFPDQYFDLVYIDANHAYAGISADLEIWLPKIKKGGIIAGHDYFVYNPGVPWTKFFGIVPAVNEFVKKHNLSIDFLTVEMVPSYAIRVK